MATLNDDLHGNAPDNSPVALLIIDMLNDLEFPEGPQFLEPTLAAARQIKQLKKQAKALKIPVVYVNDNFGRWQSDINDVVNHCLHDGVRGEPVVRLLKPEADDYVVLKPKHSAFYATTLDALLEYLNAERLILTGISADLCVLFAANDAYMRDFRLNVPTDCVAAGSPDDTRAALAYMQRVLKADTTPAAELDLAALLPTEA
ncbi:isochorismatase family protein [Rudanella paleaurantiibacter]|uniref:Isochorismatase family protein n=1 Tax=Rudanella paleaurantiibacter TaxID=2614655 RepID=A0A7J5TZZ2_9BACT|nr:isochorismatase family cysteine hydrolase [Rudanella paleaurantiibacter]KAB7731062.1 isochorismatase family protein [Rudanella paleaurantiibacter]